MIPGKGGKSIPETQKFGLQIACVEKAAPGGDFMQCSVLLL